MTLSFKSLATRLTWSYASIFLVSLAFALFLLYLLVQTKLQYRVDEDLQEDLTEFQLLWQTEAIQKFKAEIKRETLSGDSEDVFIRLLDARGQQTFSSDLSAWQPNDYQLQQSMLEQLKINPEPIIYSRPRQGEDYQTHIIVGQIAPDTVLQIGESSAEIDELLGAVFHLAGLIFCAMIALAALAGWLMAKKALRGVEEVSTAAMGVANGVLHSKVSVNNHGIEIDRLAVTFNIMVERIRRLISDMREMTDNIAHDMRSPLAHIRANAELALSGKEELQHYRTSAQETVEACDRLLQMINTTLDVAEAEAGTASLQMDSVDLASLVSDACELFEPVAEDKNIALNVQVTDHCQVRGNTQYLQRMLANLLDNALKYTPPPGTVEVSVSALNGNALVQIKDTGIGISTADQAKIFERYFRCDQSRTGTGFGLGLSFVRAVIQAHGGNIDVHSEPDDGSRFTVTLPLGC